MTGFGYQHLKKDKFIYLSMEFKTVLNKIKAIFLHSIDINLFYLIFNTFTLLLFSYIQLRLVVSNLFFI